MHKIIQYRKKCIGCGICYELQPTLWRMSKKDGKATLIGARENKGMHIVTIRVPYNFSKYVAQACPVKVIQIVE